MIKSSVHAYNVYHQQARPDGSPLGGVSQIHWTVETRGLCHDSSWPSYLGDNPNCVVSSEPASARSMSPAIPGLVGEFPVGVFDTYIVANHYGRSSFRTCVFNLPSARNYCSLAGSCEIPIMQ